MSDQVAGHSFAAPNLRPATPREWLGVGAALTGLSLLMLWPLPLVFSSDLLGGGDAYVFTWNFWWFHKALAAGHNPFVTNFLFHPTGTTLYFHDFSP